MRGLLDAALRNPYAALATVLGDTLHPGGERATRRLADRARLAEGERVLDLGCGPGAARRVAHDRGACYLGVDRDPSAAGADVCAPMGALPVADASVDVVLSECALCLAGDLEAALAEARRVLAPGGRLAASDVVLARPIEALPDRLAEPLCLADRRSREGLLEAVRGAGFDVLDLENHHEDLVRARERLLDHVNVHGLLGAMGERGERLLAGVEDVEAALEARELGYVSLVAEA